MATESLKSVLMNKNIPVLKVAFWHLPDGHGYDGRIEEVYDLKYAPPMMNMLPAEYLMQTFKRWTYDRCRFSFNRILVHFKKQIHPGGDYDVPDHITLVQKGFLLGLNDQYWLRPEKAGTAWESVNYFDNVFSQDFYRMALDEKYIPANGINVMTPDLTLCGRRHKVWRIQDNKRQVVKFGKEPFYQHPFNDVVMTNVMDYLGINHVRYWVEYLNDCVVSVADNFVTPDTEFVSVTGLCSSYAPETFFPEIEHEVGKDLCNQLKVFLSGMYLIWYILDFAGYDGRVEKGDDFVSSIGFIRDVNSAQYIGLAPAHRYENCLFAKRTVSPETLYYHQKLDIHLAKYFRESALSLDKVLDIPYIVEKIFANQDIVPEDHVNFICSKVQKNISVLKDRVRSKGVL